LDRDVLAAGDGEEAWRARLRVPSRGGLIGDDGTALRCHGGAVERLSHATHGREAAVTGEVIHSAAKRERGPRGSPE
jgi:hypothetical protein